MFRNNCGWLWCHSQWSFYRRKVFTQNRARQSRSHNTSAVTYTSCLNNNIIRNPLPWAVASRVSVSQFRYNNVSSTILHGWYMAVGLRRGGWRGPQSLLIHISIKTRHCATPTKHSLSMPCSMYQGDLAGLSQSVVQLIASHMLPRPSFLICHRTLARVGCVGTERTEWLCAYSAEAPMIDRHTLVWGARGNI